MSAVTTQQNHRVPLATALAVAGVITAAGALGVAWDQSRDSTAPAQAPAQPTPTAGEYSQYKHYHGPYAGNGQGQTFQSPSGGRVQIGL
jgi:hypothetical protein